MTLKLTFETDYFTRDWDLHSNREDGMNRYKPCIIKVSMNHALHCVEVLKYKMYLYCCHLQRQQALDSGTDYLLMKACKKMVKVRHHS